MRTLTIHGKNSLNRSAQSALWAVACCVSACGSSSETTAPLAANAVQPPTAGHSPASEGAGSALGASGKHAIAGASVSTAGRAAAVAGAVAAGNGAWAAQSGMAGATANGGSAPIATAAGTMATPGAGAASPHNHDHCTSGEEPDPRDAQVMDGPDQWKSPSNGAIDLTLPKRVLDWMKERAWEPSHDAWHNVRRCKGGGFSLPGATTSSICSHTDLIPAHQECSDPEDGYQFLVMHRHMLQSLRQAFPRQKDIFAGFPHFPYNATDVPAMWRDRWGTGWAASVKQTADTLEDIEHKLSMFPTEGDLGKYIQCGGMASGVSSIHGALHFKWVVNDSPYSLGKQTVNIDNYMFWKLHGWIDSIWERYRTAKGLAADEPKLTQALTQQCMEMDTLGRTVDPTHAVDTTSPLPVEHGVFHEQVRPILEKYCASCHSESSPEAGVSLGGHITSADVVKSLVGVQTVHGGQFKRVVAGSPAQSWLYLKVSGEAMTAGCTGTMCNAQVMPPTGQVTLTSAELSTIERWIASGAAAPTQ